MGVEKLKDSSTVPPPQDEEDVKGDSPVGALSGKEETQAMPRKRKKCGGKGAVCWLLFADSSAKGLCLG